jgi:hypothetical protein
MAGRVRGSDEDGVGRSPRLTSTIEPSAKAGNTVGDTAFSDAMMLVIVSWSLLFLITYSLRNHNV